MTPQSEPSTGEAAETVRAYLAAMEARELDAARQFLGKGFVMHFPAAAPMTTLDELVAWAKPRYRFVRKTISGMDQTSAGAATIVYCRGTLHGEWPDGTAFQDVRFIDRFELVRGRIVRQDVWNDLAEARAHG